MCHYEEPHWIHSEELVQHIKPVHADPMTGGTQAGMGLETLVDRIKRLEASIAVTELSRSATPMFNQFQEESNIRGTLAPAPLAASTTNANASRTTPSAGSAGSATSNGFGNGNQLDVSNVISNPAVPVSVSITAKPNYDFNTNERVQFFNSYVPFVIRKNRVESHGPLSLVSTIRSDIYLRALWVRLLSLVVKAQESASAQCGSQNDEESEKDKQENHANGSSLKSMKSDKKLNKQLTKRALLISGDDQKFLNEITELLPSKKTSLVLFYRFFKNCYPYFPIVNEPLFVKELLPIIGGTYTISDDRLETLKVDSFYGYAILALFLIMLRISYLSISSKEFETNPDFAELKTRPITQLAISYAHICLDKYKHMRKSYSIRILQIVLLLKFYYSFCPEDEDTVDGSESQILISNIVGQAYALGLHRDPEKLVRLSGIDHIRPKMELWRKVWYQILLIDVTKSVHLGIPPLVSDEDSYDTMLPTVEVDVDTIDLFVLREYKFTEKKIKFYRDIAKKLSSIKNPVTILELIEIVDRLNKFSSVEVGTIQDIISNRECDLVQYKIKKLTELFDIHSVILGLNYQIFLHFEKTNEIKKFTQYLIKLLTITLKTMNTTINIFYNFEKYFGLGHMYIIRPGALKLILRAFGIIDAIILRCNQIKLFYKKEQPDSKREHLFEGLIKVLFENADTMMQLLAKLSRNKYNPSKISLGNRIILNELKEPGFDINKVVDEIVFPKPGTVDSELKPGDDKNYQISMNMGCLRFEKDQFPKSSPVIYLTDEEVQYLIDISKPNFSKILKPLISKSKIPKPTIFTQNHTPASAATPGVMAGVNVGNEPSPTETTASNNSTLEVPPTFNNTFDNNDVSQNNTLDEFAKLLSSSGGSDYNLKNFWSEDFNSVSKFFEDFDLDKNTWLFS